MLESVEFLFTGANPVQTGVVAGTFTPQRIAVVRGQVLSRDNSPKANVTLSVKGHPEFGQTKTNAEGVFDLAVNGGGLLTLDYQLPGHLPAQRQMQMPVNDFAVMDDVVLLELDPVVSTIDLTDNSSSFQVARGSQTTDADGSRQATLLFPAGTSAQMTLPDGSIQPLSTLHVRATEYTVGENGPMAMPGELPPASGYTYAAELSVDEAMAQGATRVEFSQPVSLYVDNFLNFPVGEPVPVGWYDRQKSAWVPADNGRVVGILEIVDGMAVLDLEGAGQPADSAALAALGITDAERAQLASLYAGGKSLWRVAIGHFTPIDCNWPYGLPQDIRKLPGDEDQYDQDGDDYDEPDGEGEPDCNNVKNGCLIYAPDQALGEYLSLTGTSLRLAYQSQRANGDSSDSDILIRVTHDDLAGSLPIGIILEIAIAGKRIRQAYPVQPGVVTNFHWDGLDAYGNWKSAAVATITLKYLYVPVYYRSLDDAERSFLRYSPWAGTGAIGDSRVNSLFYVSRTWKRELRSNRPIPNFSMLSVGNWAIDKHHYYEPATKQLFLGNGKVRAASDSSRIIHTIAGNYYFGSFGEGGPAAKAYFSGIQSLAVAPDGGIYLADSGNYQIRYIDPSGIVTRVGGNGVSGYLGDGGPAIAAQIGFTYDIALGPDGSLYFADYSNNRVRRIGVDGVVTTVAGNGTDASSGDDGLAVEAGVIHPTAIAVGKDGSLYVAEPNRIRQVLPDGHIYTIAGTGVAGYSGDGGSGINAQLNDISDIALGSNGDIYVSDRGNKRIRKINSSGIITTIAGSGEVCELATGDIAINACISPRALEITENDSVILTTEEHQLLMFSEYGHITLLSNGVDDKYSGDFGPAQAASYSNPRGMAFLPDGSLLIADRNSIRQISSKLPGIGANEYLIASNDGAEQYHFNAWGRHLRTLDSLTGVVLRQFQYDGNGALVGILDRNGNLTRIERQSGQPVAVVAPDGQRTGLTLDANGYLTKVTDPAGNEWRMEYDAGGLMTAFTQRNGDRSEYRYDNEGRLIEDADPLGGGWQISRTKDNGAKLITLTSGEGRSESYRQEVGAGVGKQTIVRRGATTLREIFWDLVRTTKPDGTVTETGYDPDPRYGQLSPYVSSHRISTPGGLTLQKTIDRQARDIGSGSVALTTTSVTNGAESISRYDPISNTWSHTSPEGRISTTWLDGLGRVSRSEPPGLAPISLSYDGRGRLSSLVWGEGAEQRNYALSYDSNGYLSALTDPLGRQTSFTNDILGRVQLQTRPDGGELSTGFDAEGNLVSLTPPGRGEHLFDYTAVGLESAYDPPAVPDVIDTRTLRQYNLDKQLTRLERPDGKDIDLSYDPAKGWLDSISTPEGDTSYTYDAAGRLAQAQGPEGNSLSYNYDGHLPTSITWGGEVEGQLGMTWDNYFRLASLDIQGGSINYAYDRDGLLEQVGDLVLMRSRASGLVVGSSIDGDLSAQVHNAFGELVSDSYSPVYEMALTAENTVSNDPLANLDITLPGMARVEVNGASYDLDEQGMKTLQFLLQPGSNLFVAKTYDAGGGLMGETHTTVSLDTSLENPYPMDRLLAAAPDGTLYLAAGQTVYRASPGAGVNASLGQPQSWAELPDWLGPYDLGQATVDGLTGYLYAKYYDFVLEIRPDGVDWLNIDFYSSGMELAGLAIGDGGLYVMAREWGESETVTLTLHWYDLASGQLSTLATLPEEVGWYPKLASSSWGVVVLGEGGMLYRVRPDGSLDPVYQFAGGDNIDLAIDPSGRACAFVYDYKGFDCAAPDPHGQWQAEATIIPPYAIADYALGSGGSLWWLREDTGRLYRHQGGQIVAAWGDDLPAGLSLRAQGWQEQYHQDYTRDALGRITVRTETIQGQITTHAYSYDLAGRLASHQVNGLTVGAWTYDANGNRQDAMTDAQDRLTAQGAASYSYTANGELAEKGVGPAITRFEYDLMGALRRVELPNGQLVEYLADPQGRRIGRKVDGILTHGFLWQGQSRIIAELDGAGQVTSRFIYADKPNVPSYIEKGGNRYRIVSDHLGSPRLVIDTLTDEIIQRLDYDVWGKVTQDTNPGFQPFGFAGGLHDPATGLVRFGHRDYDPEAGRWTAKDPIRFAGGDANLYGYVWGDPVNGTDPDGLAGLNNPVMWWKVIDGANTAADIGSDANSLYDADTQAEKNNRTGELIESLINSQSPVPGMDIIDQDQKSAVDVIIDKINEDQKDMDELLKCK